MVAFGIAALHRRKDLWGEDADDFRPERWVHEKSSSVSTTFIRLGHGDTYLLNTSRYLPFSHIRLPNLTLIKLIPQEIYCSTLLILIHIAAEIHPF